MTISKRTRQIQAAEQAVRELLLANEAETPEQAARPLRLAMQNARDYAALTGGNHEVGAN